MSLSGSSASRKSSWAITRFARSSSMKVGRKMIRSLSRREKMSNARSPRGVCSTTIGTRAMGDLLASLIGSGVREAGVHHGWPETDARRSLDLRLPDESLERHPVAQSAPERVQVAALLHHTTNGRRRPLARLGQALDLGVDVGVARGDPLTLGDGLEHERPPDRLLRRGPELPDHLGVVPVDAL